MVTEHCAELFNICVNLFAIAKNGYKALVTLKVWCDYTCACVWLVAENTVTNVVIVRSLNTVKKNWIFKLCWVAYNCTSADNCIASDKGALSDFGIFADDERSAEICGVKNLCTLCNPHIFSPLFVDFGIKSFSEFNDKFAYFRKSLPRIINGFKQGLCNSPAVIKQIFCQ